MSFKGNIAREGNANTTMFFIIEDKKKKRKNDLDFSQRTVKVLQIYFAHIY